VKVPSEHGWRWAGLTACVALAASLRLWLANDWLGYDESVNYMIGKSATWGDFLFQYLSRAHPPLSYALTMPFLALGSSAPWARMAALLCGLVGVVLIHQVLREALRPASGEAPPAAVWLGTLLLSSAPLFVALSVQVRGYSLCLVFVWASLGVALRMHARRTQRFSDHLSLAVLLGLATFTEFAAALHLVALAAVVYAPLWIGWLRRGEWRRLLVCSAPLAGSVGLVLLVYLWQMGARRGEFGHTRHALYGGSLADPAGILAFLGERLPAHAEGILPHPWGLAVLILLLPPFTPLIGSTPLARRARVFASYGLLALGLVFVASLLRSFPFGGLPRHGVAILPGVLLAAALSLAACIQHRLRVGRGRVVAAAVVVVAFAPAFVSGLRAERSDPRTRRDLAEQIGVSAFAEAPGPVVTNRQGRALLSWWLLPGSAPHRIHRGAPRFVVFDYEGLSVVESFTPQQALDTALFYAGRVGACWVLLSYRKGGDEAERVHAFLAEALAGRPALSVQLRREPDWLLDTVVARIASPRVAAAPGGVP
jgi:hypothetical protein